MRVAIIHDWLTIYAGAEKVLKELLTLYPEADLYSLIDFFPDEQRGHLLHKHAKTTFLQRLPFVKRHYPLYLPLMPLAIEQLDLRKYDLILSSSYAVAKGVILSPYQRHICYCHTPMRYAWDLENDYLSSRSLVRRCVMHKMRQWDALSSHRVDTFVAPSHFIAKRIEKCYRRKSIVVSPPIDLSFFSLHEQKEDYYLTASRFVPYKRIDLLVKAFSQMPEKKLVVVGSGPEEKRIKKGAAKNIAFLGHVSDETLRELMQRAKGFLFAGVEDFGMVMGEALACGTPVIALRKGGATEIVEQGVFFDEQTMSSVQEAVATFEKREFDPKACRKSVARFSPSHFRAGMTRVIQNKEQEYESCDLGRWKWNEVVAPFPKLLPQTISHDWRGRVVSSADRQEDECDCSVR